MSNPNPPAGMPDMNNPTGEMVPESHGALLPADAQPASSEGNPEAEGAAPATPEGAAPQGPKMLDIEGYGEMSMEDIQSILEQHTEAADALKRLGELDARASELDSKAKELADLAKLRDMISDNDEIRSDLEKRLPEWKQILENKKMMETPAIKELRGELQELRQWKAEIDNRAAEVKINTIFEELGKQYPGVVDDQFRRTVLAETVGAFQGNPNSLGPTQLFAVANATAKLMRETAGRLQKNGQDSVIRAMKAQPPGTRLMTGGGAADAAPANGIPTAKTEKEFAALLAERAISFGQE